MTTRILAILALLVFPISLPTQAADPQGDLRVAIPWTPESLDPTMNLSLIRAQVGASLFNSLVGRDSEKRIVPELADSWKLLDENTWLFRLRKGRGAVP
jgi:peptide/nickel transport system substrate-binding protein